MKVLVCITKVAEVEVDLEDAREYLTDVGHDISDWSDDTIAEEFTSDLEAIGNIEFEYDRVITIVTKLEEVAA